MWELEFLCSTFHSLLGEWLGFSTEGSSKSSCSTFSLLRATKFTFVKSQKRFFPEVKQLQCPRSPFASAPGLWPPLALTTGICGIVPAGVCASTAVSPQILWLRKQAGFGALAPGWGGSAEPWLHHWFLANLMSSWMHQLCQTCPCFFLQQLFPPSFYQQKSQECVPGQGNSAVQQSWGAGAPHGADLASLARASSNLGPLLPGPRASLSEVPPAWEPGLVLGPPGSGTVPRQSLVDVLGHGCGLLVPGSALAVHGVIQLQRSVQGDLGNSQREGGI